MYKQRQRNKSNERVKPYNQLDEVADDRIFKFGSIWQIRDKLINIPNIDRLEKRNYHFTRCVVIVDNSKENANPESLAISVVPLSSQIKCKRKFDIELDKNKDQVLEDSIVMLDYVQPVLKKDLYKCVGEITREKKYELLESFMTKMGITSVEEMIASEDEKNR